MTRLISILAFGFWLGMKHATDADHVVAVSTIVARNKKVGTAWLLGAVWGLGHTLTIFIVGFGIIFLKVQLAPRVGLSMEFAVAVMLIALGLLNMAGYRIGSIGFEQHSHGHSHTDPDHAHEFASTEETHSHIHLHFRDVNFEWTKRHLREIGSFQLVRSGIVGLVHGLAGSAAVALLVLATIHSSKAALFYLLIFGFGTLTGMLILSSMMEFSMIYLARWWAVMERSLTFVTGLLSLLFGLYVAYHVGYVDGLFLAHPHWTPR